MINIALYKPDIPQNTAAIVRLCACFEIKIHIIEPCGFNLNDSRFKRVVMDYANLVNITRYENYANFISKNKNSRIILMTTKAKKKYFNFKFISKDIILFGRESAGVPKAVHTEIKNKLKIPMNKNARSLNISMTAAIVVSEAFRQLN
jgi:tRNA (cytidine/uridine-2'-O-)-methyltransferase|tara:strand:+ start:89 stop:532 length:444 start_codon:yes stop_codon:yes gene_type:complete